MSEPIQVGDTVTWWIPPTWPEQPGRMDTGTVLYISYKPVGRPFARVENKYGQRNFVNLDKLTRLAPAGVAQP